MSLEFEHLISEDLTPKRLRYVYHYTSLDSFRKIVSGENNEGVCFKASNSDALNDTSEFLTGVEFLLDIWKNCYHEPEEYLQEMKQKLDLRKSKTFVVSFSSNKDSLPMWAMYARDNGVSMKFSMRRLWDVDRENLLDKPRAELSSLEQCRGEKSVAKANLFFLKCFYGSAKFKEKLISLEKAGTVNSILLKEELMLTAPYLLKNAAYKHEKEIRCVIDFENADAEVNHYITFPKRSLTGIVIGPCSNKESLKREVSDVLSSCGYRNIPIEYSTIPYRNVGHSKKMIFREVH